MKRRPLQWSARGLPDIRRGLIDTIGDISLAAGEGSGRVAKMSAWSEDRSRRIALAELYYVTADMAQLALDASLDVPTWDPDSLPCRNGLIATGAPLPPIRDLAVWGIWWSHTPDGYILTSLTRTSRGLVPVEFASAPSVATDIGRFPAITRGLPRPTPGVVAWLSAAAVMMQTPTIAERRSLDARTGGSPREQTRPADLVTTIDLRPLRHVDTGDERDASGRVYRHRWIVRGHWTHQPYGPGRELRKLIYRAPYVKGPSGAPLLATEKVQVWRR